MISVVGEVASLAHGLDARAALRRVAQVRNGEDYGGAALCCALVRLRAAPGMSAAFAGAFAASLRAVDSDGAGELRPVWAVLFLLLG